MNTASLIKDSHFDPIAEVKPDVKNRVTLGRRASRTAFYRVYQNDVGQIILDPMETIPAHEAWLFRNKKAAASVFKGLNQARGGRIKKSSENFAKYLPDDE